MPRYSSTLMDHARDPRNGGELDPPRVIGKASLSGGRAPRVTMYLRAVGDQVEAASFQTFGCGCTIASCSMLTEMVKGGHIDAARSITTDELADKLGGMPPDKRFCAEVAVSALRDAVEHL